jgi:flotillin
MEPVTLLLALAGIGFGSATLMVRKFYHICQPSEVLIFAGPSSRTSSGKEVGYRLIKGGSSLQIPLLEMALRMELTNMTIDLRVTNAYSKGGIPLNVEGVANIKIAGEDPIIHNAIERLLGKTRKEIEELAKETLEGNLRGILASLTPEQVNEDKLAFAKILLEEAEDDLEKLGLVLDTLQIQNISDEVHYLDSIGRKQQAELQRDARIAEAQAQAESIIRASENERVTALRRIERDVEVAKADADRRVRDSLTRRTAAVAEVESLVHIQVAKAQAELAVQRERIKQVEYQLQADVIAPAEANRQTAIAVAKGNASQIIAAGEANSSGIRQLATSWQAAGSSAREMFIYQKLEPLMDVLAQGVPEIRIDQLTVFDQNPAKNSAGSPSNIPPLGSWLEQLRQGTGIDAPQLLQQFVQKSDRDR